MQVQPYLIFEGRCEEAIEFYKSAVGAKVNALMRFKDSPQPHASGQCPADTENKVMHGSLLIGDSTVLVSDGRCTGQPKFSGISMTLPVADDAEAERFFAALGAGGKVTMPMAKTFFASRFGMLNDRFGVSWMIIVRT
jgi:PhnB protein